MQKQTQTKPNHKILDLVECLWCLRACFPPQRSVTGPAATQYAARGGRSGRWLPRARRAYLLDDAPHCSQCSGCQDPVELCASTNEALGTQGVANSRQTWKEEASKRLKVLSHAGERMQGRPALTVTRERW